ncbi:hypothetical protein QNI19_08460 [Cytophagaceae bacterium DM2B3-1]|uniref:BRCT domain-containing protein n=1 Tax=Xanthocytophaga flava TaxID=3048013 RepID=A0ABT7CGU6_9BACT|nr:hypothetical protein [Xanthocytophaga flavus]MDJ1492961.1 hypothetical protein [Xanthocytophaga flavus]
MKNTLFFGSSKDIVSPQEAEKLSEIESIEIFYDFVHQKTYPFCDVFEKLLNLSTLTSIRVENFVLKAQPLEEDLRFLKLLSSVETLTRLEIGIYLENTENESFLDILGGLKNLKELKLGNRSHRCFADHFKLLPNFINQLPNLELLDIEVCTPCIFTEDLFLPLHKLKRFHLTIWDEPQPDLVRIVINNLIYLPEVENICVKGMYNQSLPVGNLIVFPKSHNGSVKGANLQNITFKNLNLGQLPGCLLNVKELNLEDNTGIDLDQALSCLNPEELESLELRNCAISELPVRIGQFRKLQKMDLGGNPVKKLPIEIGLLDNLTNLSAVYQKIQIYTNSPFSNFLSHLRIYSFTDEEKKAGVAIYFQKNDYLDSVPLSIILPLLLISQSTIAQNVLALLEKKIADSIGATSDPCSLCICLFGSVEGMSTRELKEKCRKHNIQLETTLTDKTSHILIGKGITEEQIKQMQQSNLPLVTGTQLKSYLEKLDTPFLKKSDTHTQTNLTRLLISVDPANVQVALEMINQGGLPESILYTLVLVVLQKELDSKVKKKAMTMLEKYVSAEIVAVVKRIRMKTDYLKIIQLLWKSSEIDKTLLARTILQLELSGNFMICSEEFQQVQSVGIPKNNLYSLLKNSVEDADLVLQSQTDTNGILTWVWFPLDKLTSSKASLDKIEALKIHISDFAKKKKPLKSFTSLKTLCLTNTNASLQEQAKASLEKLQQDLPYLKVVFS